MELFWSLLGIGMLMVLFCTGIGLALYLEAKGEALKSKARKEEDKK